MTLDLQEIQDQVGLMGETVQKEPKELKEMMDHKESKDLKDPLLDLKVRFYLKRLFLRESTAFFSFWFNKRRFISTRNYTQELHN